jgi:hypothetical protein
VGVVPRHPLTGIPSDLLRVLHRGQHVPEGVHSVGPAGFDHRHEPVAHVGPSLDLVVQAVLAVQDGRLQQPLALVVVQRSTSNLEDFGQRLPSVQHVPDRSPEAPVRLDLPLLQPLLELAPEILQHHHTHPVPHACQRETIDRYPRALRIIAENRLLSLHHKGGGKPLNSIGQDSLQITFDHPRDTGHWFK